MVGVFKALRQVLNWFWKCRLYNFWRTAVANGKNTYVYYRARNLQHLQIFYFYFNCFCNYQFYTLEAYYISDSKNLYTAVLRISEHWHDQMALLFVGPLSSSLSHCLHQTLKKRNVLSVQLIFQPHRKIAVLGNTEMTLKWITVNFTTKSLHIKIPILNIRTMKRRKMSYLITNCQLHVEHYLCTWLIGYERRR